ncbi:PREDICTED: late secretory pathway protein AVL9 homolog [Galeopterus variegatus]|uniref:Late secretory pathway protein AVL9 homolog n=1 Tax=Galeopterus variegatus TaxID=482537 RepID=A0ABM0QQN2_GALVR|nr:PREDICTED: late secretory pathway protein AVL9 homolog [Galeopterus variegatus]
MEKAGRGGSGAPRGPVLHIVVVGFHHKKGCQVEFSYPPLIPGDGHDSHTLPEEWKYLPFLALPDGAHNYQEANYHDCGFVLTLDYLVNVEKRDTRYERTTAAADDAFTECGPSPMTRQQLRRVGSGVSCHGYAGSGLSVDDGTAILKERASAFSRSPSRLDQSEAERAIRAVDPRPSPGSASAPSDPTSQVPSGPAPPRRRRPPHQVTARKQRKRMREERLRPRRAARSCSASSGTPSLSCRPAAAAHGEGRAGRQWRPPGARAAHRGGRLSPQEGLPGMIEHGLSDCSQYRPRKSMTEEAGLQESNPPADNFVCGSTSDISNTNLGTVKKIMAGNHGDGAAIKTEEHLFQEDDSKGQEPNNTNQYLKLPSRPSPESSESDWETLDPSILEDPNLKEREQVGSDQTNLFPKDSVPSDSPPITVQPQAHIGQVVLIPGLISGLEEDQYGMPLAIFTKVEEALIQTHDPELRKLLIPTTADLRFADYLVRHVTENRDDVFLDGTGWEGGDEWIRAQFAVYIHALLAATLQLDNEKILSDYGTTFVTAWKNTHNYRVWNSNKHPALAEINPNHPFQGQYSVSDMKLRFSHSVQNSERGKKIGNVMVTTSRNVVQTGKAVGQSVGGAFSSAKTAMSSWLSTFTNSTPQSLTEPPDGKP